MPRKFSAVFKSLEKNHPDIVEKKRRSCGEQPAELISSDLSYLYQLNHYDRRPEIRRNSRRFHRTHAVPGEQVVNLHLQRLQSPEEADEVVYGAPAKNTNRDERTSQHTQEDKLEPMLEGNANNIGQ